MTDAIILAPSGAGADRHEFQREARAFARWLEAHGTSAAVELFEAPPHKPWHWNLAGVSELIARHRYPRRLAFLCHGLRSGIMAGYERSTVGELAELLVKLEAHPDVHVHLYACSTGGEDPRGPRCFARVLRSELEARGFKGGRILAHTMLGHTTRNRMLRILEVGLEDELADSLVVSPSEHELWRGLGLYLSHTDDGRWKAATMTRAELRAAALELSQLSDKPDASD